MPKNFTMSGGQQVQSFGRPAIGQQQQMGMEQQSFGPTISRDNTYFNGRQMGSRSYNPNTHTFSNNINMSTPDKNIMKSGQNGYKKMLGQIPGALAVTPEEHQRFISELYDPQAAKLKSEYNNTLGDTMSAANSSGMSNSIGFENYRANQLDKNLTQGLGDLYNQASLQAYELPNMKLSPISNAMSLYDASIEGPFNRAMRTFEPSYQGFTSGNNLGFQQYQMGQQYQPQQSPGFFGSLFS